MTLYELVAYENPYGAKKVLNDNGYKAIPNPNALAKQLAKLVTERKEEALYQVALQHPDYDLIINAHEHKNKLEGKDKEKEKEECSCKEEKSIFSSAEGQEIKRAVEELKNNQNNNNNNNNDNGKSEKTEMLIIGAVVITALALILK